MKAQNYKVQCTYILTCDKNINVTKIRARYAAGGHDVPEDKIKVRYHHTLTLKPCLIGEFDI